MDQIQKLYVVTATIAAELAHAAEVANEMSLIAKNARAISMRAGEKAVGFKPITVFITEFSDNTIEQANKINQLAISISQLSIIKSHSERALQNFRSAWDIAGEESNRSAIKPIIHRLSEQVKKGEGEIQGLFQLLQMKLEESEMQIRAAFLLATTAKTEASRAEEYQDSLNAIAEKIEGNATIIREHLQKSKNELSHCGAST